MKVYWVSLGGVVAYDVNQPEHRFLASKFLYWEQEDILLVGSIEIQHHVDVCKKAGALTPKRVSDGAGSIFNEKIVSWESIGFGIDTPKKIRKIIAETLDFEEDIF